jgi:hypothetical protein
MAVAMPPLGPWPDLSMQLAGVVFVIVSSRQQSLQRCCVVLIITVHNIRSRCHLHHQYLPSL